MTGKARLRQGRAMLGAVLYAALVLMALGIWPENAAAVPIYQMDFLLRDHDVYHRSHSGIAGAQSELPFI